MSVHEDTLQGLQEALQYVKGDKSKARSSLVPMPDSDVILKFNSLPEEDKKAITVIIDKMLIANSRYAAH